MTTYWNKHAGPLFVQTGLYLEFFEQRGNADILIIVSLISGGTEMTFIKALLIVTFLDLWGATDPLAPPPPPHRYSLVKAWLVLILG